MDELRVWIRLPVLIFRFYFAPSRLCVNSSEMVSRKVDRNLRRAYKLMRARFGHQHWWPGETPFEVCVGAILTQNTAWANVEHALANLKAACVLEPARLFALPGEVLKTTRFCARRTSCRYSAITSAKSGPLGSGAAWR